MTYEYKTHGVCSSKITFKLKDDMVSDIKFKGGCDGNLKALSKLLDGMTATEINEKLCGIRCGTKITSCSDQLSIAVKHAYEEAKAKKLK